MSFLKRLFGKLASARPSAPLYSAVVAAARTPDWYVEGEVPDTIDGRFEMVAAMMSLALLRLEREGEAYAAEAAELTESFVDDMDGQLREIGVGDVVVGKHLGKMMSALGGRLGAYRDAIEDAGEGTDTLETALLRNIYRGEAPAGGGLAWVAARMRVLHAALTAVPAGALLRGRWPQP